MNKTTLIGLFVTCLVTAQVTSSKLIAISVPILGLISFPGGTLAYAGTFFASDVMAEKYGKEQATRMVNVGFAMNFVLLALVYLTINAPVAEGSIGQTQFATVLGASVNIVAGSLVAYLVSQHYDVFAFHRLKERMDGRKLWVRNILSTSTSQLIDTVIFTLIAFAVAPLVFGVGVTLPVGVLLTIIIGQYVVKLGLALMDTPLVYLAT